MQRPKLKLVESESSLPLIKKLASPMPISRSPTNNSSHLNLVTSLSPVGKSSPIMLKSDEKGTNSHIDIFTNKSKVIFMKLSRNTANKKLADLIKTIEEQDHYIRSLETEFNISKNEFSLKAFKSFYQNSQSVNESKNELDSILQRTREEIEDPDIRTNDEQISTTNFLREEGKKNKYKDYEIYKLKRQVDENQNLIEKLTIESNTYKIKLQEYEEANQKIEKTQKEIEEIKEKYNAEIEKIKGEVYEKEMMLNCKMIDFNDMSDLLKRSEEKRHYSNEYNAFMEKNSAKLQDKIATLNHQRIKILMEIEETNKKIAEKEELIQALKKKIEKAESDLEYEKMKGSTLAFNYESAKESIKEINEQNEILKNKYKNEKFKLEQAILLENEKNNPENAIRRATQPPVFDSSKEEIFKLQQKCTAVEKELYQAKEDFEKLKKNEAYLQNQLKMKDLMIAQIENLMKESVEKPEKKEQKKNPAHNPKNSIDDLVSLVEEMKNRYNSSEDTIKCAICQKMPNECFLAVPCGHLSCGTCKNTFESVCQYCKESIIGIVHASSLDRIVYNFKKENETIERARKLLGN